MGAEKCVLAYSGGLDTSVIVPWLMERRVEVHAVLVDVGQDEDLEALCDKALRMGAKTAQVRDAKPAMFKYAIPYVIGLNAAYENAYRLGTALARPFIALEQIRVAKEFGGATLVHGATGKGNDQIRFEFAYRSLAPECPILAPWKTWEFGGRVDLVDYLKSKGFEDNYEVTKDFSLDENLWHLSIEGGPLEDASSSVKVEEILAAMSDRFAGGAGPAGGPSAVAITFEKGVPVAVNGMPAALPGLVGALNCQYRNAGWAWDLVIENRFTGIKSRGLYLNPAAKLLQMAVDALARTCLNKPMYDEYAALGQKYATMLYRGEYFSDQRKVFEAAGDTLMRHLTGTVTMQLEPTPYAAKIETAEPIFRREMATFEKSRDYAHRDAEGFIHLTWLSSIGRACDEDDYAGALEAGTRAASSVQGGEPVPA